MARTPRIYRAGRPVSHLISPRCSNTTSIDAVGGGRVFARCMLDASSIRNLQPNQRIRLGNRGTIPNTQVLSQPHSRPSPGCIAHLPRVGVADDANQPPVRSPPHPLRPRAIGHVQHALIGHPEPLARL